MNPFVENIAVRYNIDVNAAHNFVGHFNITDINKSELIVEKKALTIISIF